MSPILDNLATHRSMRRCINVMVWTALAVGMMQYLPIVLKGLLTANISLWALSEDELAGAGLLRYIKDAFLIIIGILWPIWAIKLHRTLWIGQIIRGYAIWGLIILTFAIGPYIYSTTPAFIFLAGLRWLLLMHAAMGIFVLILLQSLHARVNSSLPLGSLSVLLGINLIVAASQFGSIDFATYGNTRTAGLFGNAGVLAALSVGFAAVGLCHPSQSRRHILLYMVGCFLLAGFTGSRYAIVTVGLMTIATLLLPVYSTYKRNSRVILAIAAITLIIIIAIPVYNTLINFVGRGDLISSQFGEGGRVSNAIYVVGKVMDANFSTILFGSGLGTGTNSAIIFSNSRGINPESIKFNLLVDNGFITLILQFGMIGSLVFIAGWFLFFKKLSKKLIGVSNRLRFFLLIVTIIIIMFAGGFLEQIYLMIGFAVAFGYLVGSVGDIPVSRHLLMNSKRSRYLKYFN